MSLPCQWCLSSFEITKSDFSTSIATVGHFLPPLNLFLPWQLKTHGFLVFKEYDLVFQSFFFFNKLFFHFLNFILEYVFLSFWMWTTF